jgi:hypothetical protein
LQFLIVGSSRRWRRWWRCHTRCHTR